MKKDSFDSFIAKDIPRRGFFRRVTGFLASHWLLTTLSFGTAGVFAWSWHDTVSLKLENWDLFYPNLPQKLAGKKLGHLSDLHLESLPISPEKLAQAVNSQKPDLLVITGDVISTRTDLDKVLPYLGQLNAPYGKYIVMGNNDYSHFSRTLFKRYLNLLKSIGWIPLLNASEFVPSLNLWIIGIDDPATAHDDVPKAFAAVESALTQPSGVQTPQAPFRLVLSHSTDCLDDVIQYGADLLLTGHTHGGQIRLPKLKPLVTNTYLGDEGIYEGYHVIEGIPTYINRGLGGSTVPLRLNVPPEIAFFTLNKGDSSPSHSVQNV